MNLKCIRVVLTLNTLWICTLSTAVPTAFDKTTSVTNQTDSIVLADTLDPKKIWVLPPMQGSIAGAQATLSVEVAKAECESLTNIVDATKLYADQIKILAQVRKNLVAKLLEPGALSPEEIAKIYAQTEATNSLIVSAMKSADSAVSDSARKHGGTIRIPYTHMQNNNIAVIRASNPSFTNVSAVQTSKVRVYFTAPGSNKDGVDLAMLPIISDYSVAGIKAEKAAAGEAQLAPTTDVTLSLTRIGGCMMAYPEKFGVSPNPQKQFSMTAIYEYPYSFRTSVKASYNLLSIYKLAISSGTKGGFFSSSSYSNTVESTWGESAFKISWAEEDPESKVSASDRLAIERSIKADLLANLDLLIASKFNVSPGQAANPGPRGAVVLAEGLEKTCAMNGYCAATAMALRFLDATFGSSSTSSNFEKTIDVKATYSMDSTTARYITQGVVYSGE